MASSLLPPARMPWPVDQLPGVFTSFRQKVERAGITPLRHCLHPPSRCPPDVPMSVLQAVGAKQGAEASSYPRRRRQRCPLILPLRHAWLRWQRGRHAGPPGAVPGPQAAPIATRATRNGLTGPGLLQQVLALAGYRGTLAAPD